MSISQFGASVYKTTFFKKFPLKNYKNLIFITLNHITSLL